MCGDVRLRVVWIPPPTCGFKGEIVFEGSGRGVVWSVVVKPKRTMHRCGAM